MPQLNTSERFLLEYIRSDSGDSFADTLRGFLETSNDKDWSAVINQGFKLTPYIYSELKNFRENSKIPKEVWRALKLQYIFNFGRNLTIKRMMLELTKEFNKEKIDLIFLKGTALLTTVYKHDMGLRLMQDVDVLVRKDDLPKAENILKHIGYREDYEKLSELAKVHLSRDFFSKHHFHYIYFKDQIMLELSVVKRIVRFHI